jgi:hypothetical protein
MAKNIKNKRKIMLHIEIRQIDFDMQMFSFMHVVECLNEPNHACCAYNNCTNCIGD